MVLSKRLEPPDLIAATLRGVVTPSDHADVIGDIRDIIARVGTARVLLVLDDFGGWVPDATIYSAESWLDDDEDRVSKIAVVGLPEWRKSILTLAAQPIRRTPVRYFTAESDARQWLGAAQDEVRVPN